MVKNKIISLKIWREQYNKLKELDIKMIDCWELGFNQIIENQQSELEKKVKKVYTEYIRLKTKLDNFGKKLDSEHKELDRLLVWYTKQNRSIDKPTSQDIDTVKFQLRKRDISSFTVEQVFEYWRNKGDKSK